MVGDEIAAEPSTHDAGELPRRGRHGERGRRRRPPRRIERYRRGRSRWGTRRHLHLPVLGARVKVERDDECRRVGELAAIVALEDARLVTLAADAQLEPPLARAALAFLHTNDACPDAKRIRGRRLARKRLHLRDDVLSARTRCRDHPLEQHRPRTALRRPRYHPRSSEGRLRIAATSCPDELGRRPRRSRCVPVGPSRPPPGAAFRLDLDRLLGDARWHRHASSFATSLEALTLAFRRGDDRLPRHEGIAERGARRRW